MDYIRLKHTSAALLALCLIGCAPLAPGSTSPAPHPTPAGTATGTESASASTTAPAPGRIVNTIGMPLVRIPRGEGPEVGFQSGWARVSWSAMQLCWEAVFLTGRASNRARRLNERTWELGDV